MFSLLSVCLFVCLFVCVQDISKCCGRIWTKLGGYVGCVTRRIDSILVKIRIRIWIWELFNFKSDSSSLRDKAKNDIVLYSMIFKKCIGLNMFLWIRYYVADICTLPSALPVLCVIVWGWDMEQQERYLLDDWGLSQQVPLRHIRYPQDSTMDRAY